MEGGVLLIRRTGMMERPCAVAVAWGKDINTGLLSGADTGACRKYSRSIRLTGSPTPYWRWCC
jgi:hypothetical protein